MATFNPGIPENNTPDWTNASQRNSGLEDTFKTLFSGVGRAIEQTAEFVDFTNQSRIKSEITTAIDAIQGPIARSGGVSQSLIEPTQAASSTTPGSSDPESAADGYTNMPKGVSAPLGNRMATLKAQNTQGVLPDTLYFTQLDALVRNMKNKYPTYADEIDKLVQSKTGHMPAEALRRSIINDVERADAAERSSRSSDQTYVDREADWINKADPTFLKKWQTGNATPMELAEVKVNVGKLKSLALDQDLAAKQNALEASTNSLTKEKARSRFQTSVDNYINVSLNQKFTAVKAHIDKLTTSGQPLDPQTVLALGAEIERLKTEAALEIDKLGTNPWLEIDKSGTNPRSVGSYSSVLDTKDYAAVKEQALTRFDLLKKAITDNDIGLIKWNSLIIKGTQEAATRKMLDAVPGLTYMMSIKDAIGDSNLQWLMQQDQTGNLAKNARNTAQQLAPFLAGAAITGGSKDDPNKPVINQPTELVKFLNDNGTPKGELGAVTFDVLKNGVNFITSAKDLNSPDVVKWAKFLFTSEARSYFKDFNIDSQQQLFNLMASPTMTEKMKAMGASDPGLWNNYVKWTTDEFINQANKTVNAIDRIKDSPYIYLAVDADTGRLKAEIWPDWLTRYNEGSVSPAHRVGIGQAKAQLGSIDNFNRSLSSLDPIFKANNNGTAADFVTKILESHGYDLDKLAKQNAPAPDEQGNLTKRNRTNLIPLTDKPSNFSNPIETGTTRFFGQPIGGENAPGGFGGAKFGGAEFGGAKLGGSSTPVPIANPKDRTGGELSTEPFADFNKANKVREFQNEAGTFEGSGSLSEISTSKGLPSDYLGKTYQIESASGTNLSTSSAGAQGHFQFIPSTARHYGLKNPNDLLQSADAAARLAKDNQAGLRNSLGREPTGGEIYLAHQQGLGGALALLRHPDSLAVNVVGWGAVTQNGGKPGWTAKQFADYWISKYDKIVPRVQ